MYANSKHLTTLLSLELAQLTNYLNFNKVLQTLATGFYSLNIEVTRWCMKLFTKIGYDFGHDQKIFDRAATWFVDKEGGLELSLHALKKHPELGEDFVIVVTQFSTANIQLKNIY